MPCAKRVLDVREQILVCTRSQFAVGLTNNKNVIIYRNKTAVLED